jgi:RNA polymerase sigma-70 factor (ECF subfamily)
MDYLRALRKEILILRAEIENPESPVYVERTDNQLVALVLAGDEAAFECIFERHKRRIAVLASRFFQNSAEIEEIIQISFIKAYFDLKSFRGLYDFSLVSWLNRIAINTCLNLLKTRSAKIDNLITVLSDHEREVFAADLREKSAEDLIVQRDLLEKLLASLSVDDRALLQMLHAQEMSIAEIADVFGWSRAKVKVRAFRARRSLARIIRRFL